jgi:hypothetical protein
MNHPIIPQNGEENDTFSRYWRRCYCYLSRAGTTARIKRQYRRRVRKFLETEIINERRKMPKVKKGETRNRYVSRAIPQIMKEGLSQRQAVGKAEGMYTAQKKKKKSK